MRKSKTAQKITKENFSSNNEQFEENLLSRLYENQNYESQCIYFFKLKML